jgi:hypothetical protein
MKKFNRYLILFRRAKPKLLNNLAALIPTIFSKKLLRSKFYLQQITRTLTNLNLMFIKLTNLKLNVFTTNQIYNLN